jgi:hypothetical protein
MGLISWIISVFCLAIIGVKSAIKHGGILFSVFENVDPFDKKLAKIAAIFFVLGVLFFIWGIMSE